jgi:hypothetical protein
MEIASRCGVAVTRRSIKPVAYAQTQDRKLLLDRLRRMSLLKTSYVGIEHNPGFARRITPCSSTRAQIFPRMLCSVFMMELYKNDYLAYG